jgi:molybdopterin-biosynthesis enzyme MoeA-like protein
VLGYNVKFSATADDNLCKYSSDVKIAAYQQSIVIFDGGVAPVDVTVEA